MVVKNLSYNLRTGFEFVLILIKTLRYLNLKVFVSIKNLCKMETFSGSFP